MLPSFIVVGNMLLSLRSSRCLTLAFARRFIQPLHVAIKCVDLESTADDLDEIQHEISVLSQIMCPYLTRYYGSCAVGECLWIVTEYVDGGR